VSAPLTPPKTEGGVSAPGGVSAFLIEVDGIPVRISPGEVFAVRSPARVKLTDIVSISPLPPGTVMNFRGFVGRPGDTTGNDKGTTLDTAKDLIPRFAMKKDGETVYQLGAEDGPKLLAAAYVKIVKPVLKSVTIGENGEDRVLKLAGRRRVAPGTKLTLKKIELEDDLPLADPRITLGGRPVSSSLPSEMTMPDIAVSLAVFSRGELCGKVVLYP
jgi:hypothetical protein